MKIAVLIGISNYKNITKLPASNNDLKLIHQLAMKSEMYEDILILNGEKTSCLEDKHSLVTFLTKYHGKKITEIFFYFSGHGDFDGSEFYYIWSDYEKDKKRQTSFQNSEIDILIRKLNPDIYFKVVDACHSGISYIKDVDTISNFIKSNQNGFHKCYFLFSSQADQSSYANEEYSFFTKSLLCSFKQRNGETIRYKDIIDSIADDFESHGQQKPFFVTQADFTESYMTITKDIETLISKIIANKAVLGGQNKDLQLIDLIKSEALNYVTKEEALEKINYFAEIDFSSKVDHEIITYFKLNIYILNSYDHLPKFELLLNWLDVNGKDLLISINKENRIMRVPIQKNSKSGIERMNAKVIKNVPVRVTSNLEFNYKAIKIELSPLFPNLTKIDIYLVPFISKTQVKLFYSKIEYLEVNWDAYEPELDNVEWNYQVFDIKSELTDIMFIHQILDPMFQNIMDNMKKKYIKTEPENLL
ncbi:caspase family protein [Leptospira sp. 96542]|nr:caspase family protein [Leptospira sp. 96542]